MELRDKCEEDVSAASLCWHCRDWVAERQARGNFEVADILGKCAAGRRAVKKYRRRLAYAARKVAKGRTC